MGSNLAPTAIITDSGYIPPYEPARVVDGLNNVPTSRWLCETSQGWIKFDLKASCWVSQWTLTSIGGSAGWPANYCMTAFQLQTSVNGSEPWVTVNSVSSNTANTYTYTFPAPVNSRYWRVYVPNGGGLAVNKDAVSIMEVQLIQADIIPLSSLALQDNTGANVALNPTFSGGTTAYTANFGYDTTSITVIPTTTDSTATITVNGAALVNGQANVNLSVGSNTVTVLLKSTAGPTLTYTITATRASSPYLQSVTGFPASISFSKTVYRYSATVSSTTRSLPLVPTAEDATATITVNGTAVASGQTKIVSLSTGSNTITIKVTSKTGADSRTYTFVITK